jgi:hypothetical protein
MSEDPPPLTAMDRATMRAMAYWNIDRAHARDMVEHTFLGRQMLANEQLLDLGRALRKALPEWLRRRLI